MNRSIDKRRVQTVPLNTRARIAKQDVLLAELDRAHDKFVVEVHRLVAKQQSAKADTDAAWAWPNSNGARIGAALRQAMTERGTDGQINDLRRALRAIKKLKASAHRGVLRGEDEDLAFVRHLAKRL